MLKIIYLETIWQKWFLSTCHSPTKNIFSQAEFVSFKLLQSYF